MLPSQKSTDTTPKHRLLGFLLIPVCVVIFVFEHTASISYKKGCWTLIGRTTLHISTVWWSISDTSGPREVNAASEQDWHKAFFFSCTVKFEVAFVKVTLYCIAWQSFPKGIPSPCGYISCWWMVAPCSCCLAGLKCKKNVCINKLNIVLNKKCEIPWVHTVFNEIKVILKRTTFCFFFFFCIFHTVWFEVVRILMFFRLWTWSLPETCSVVTLLKWFTWPV